MPDNNTIKYSPEITAAVAAKIKSFDVKNAQDLDNLQNFSVSIFSADTQTAEQRKQAYLDYSEKLLNDYYDINKDGKVTQEEFAQREMEDGKKEMQITGEYDPEIDKDKFARPANLFAKNMDANGDGVISKEELAYFEEHADHLDGKLDGNISYAGEKAMVPFVLGTNKNDKLPILKEITEKYLRGADLTPQEQQVMDMYTEVYRKNANSVINQ